MKRVFGGFFEDKKILITGHTGFIGSWLTIILNELGAKLIGYAQPPYTRKGNFVQANLETKIKSIIGDIRNYDRVKKVIKNYQPEIIFHLAAQPIVGRSYKNPKLTFNTNISGTINVFEAFKKSADSKIIINLTSDKCYENLELKRGYTENDRLGGYDPYSCSKTCSEVITNSYRKSFFNENLNENKKKVSSVRCGNIIGGGDWQEDRLIPDLMRAIDNDSDLIIKNPNSLRAWQYILEPLRGFLILTMKMCGDGNIYSSAWNLGPNQNDNFKVIEVIERFIKCIGKGRYKIQFRRGEDYFHETKLLKLDISKAKAYLEWEPILNFDEAIEFTCKWYLNENIDYDFNVKLIDEYFKKNIP